MLLYAPDTRSGELQMRSILQSLHLPFINKSKVPNLGRVTSEWILLPMKSSVSNEYKSDLTSSCLGDKLADALERTRDLICRTKSSTVQNTNESVLFLGMDSPELPMEEVVYGLKISSGEKTIVDTMRTIDKKQNCIVNSFAASNGRAHLCPAVDGEIWETGLSCFVMVTTVLICFSLHTPNRRIRTNFTTKTCSFIKSIFGHSVEPSAHGSFPVEGID